MGDIYDRMKKDAAARKAAQDDEKRQSNESQTVPQLEPSLCLGSNAEAGRLFARVGFLILGYEPEYAWWEVYHTFAIHSFLI